MIIEVTFPKKQNGASVAGIPGIEGCRIAFDQSQSFSDLSGLEQTIDQCIDNGIPFSIEGLPACVLEERLGSLMYGLVMQEMGKDRPATSALSQSGAAQLITCRHCVLRDDCPGVGPLPENHRNRMYRIRKEHRLEAWELVCFQDAALNDKYHRYIRHLAEFPLELTDRAMTFPRTITPGGKAQYDERFVYFCRYMTPEDIPREKGLLLETMRCHDYVKTVFGQWYEKGIMPSVACSFAAGESDRESLYLYFATQKLIADFLELGDIKPVLRPHEMLWFVGVDFSGGQLSGYKVYTKFPDDNAFLSALRDEVGLSLTTDFIGATDHYLLARRFTAEGRQVGIKMEFCPIDHEQTRKEVKLHWNLDMGNTPDLYRDEIVAVDLDGSGNASKMTIYMRKELRGVDFDTYSVEA